MFKFLRDADCDVNGFSISMFFATRKSEAQAFECGACFVNDSALTISRVFKRKVAGKGEPSLRHYPWAVEITDEDNRTGTADEETHRLMAAHQTAAAALRSTPRRPGR